MTRTRLRLIPLFPHLVKSQVVDFLFHEDDAARYRQVRPGELFKPKRMPTGIWLQVDDFKNSPSWENLQDFISEENVARGLQIVW
jgi:hypothetical protein